MEVLVDVPLSPEEIEARRFRLAQNGYDCESVDRFLAEIAEALRAPASSAGGADEFGRLGQEIAAILRNARDSAGAVRAEAEGQAAAVRSRAEVEAEDLRKAAEAECEALIAQAGAEADDARHQARSESDTMRAVAQADADEIRLDAERQLEAATLARARAEEAAAAAQANAEREAAAKLERAQHEARRLADAITADAAKRAEALHESEQSTYLRLLAARDDLQQAIDRLVAGLEAHDPGFAPRGGTSRSASPGDAADGPGPDLLDDSVVDLTTAPPQVHPSPAADEEPERIVANPRRIASVGLDAPNTGADPLLRMVRAAVGRASEGSNPDDPQQEASAS